MFNPITIIQTVWNWFLKTFSSITTFSGLKFFFVGILLLITSWYYVNCYETPVYNTGYFMLYVLSKPIEEHHISQLEYRFDYNGLRESKTSAKLIYDTLRINVDKDYINQLDYLTFAQRILLPHRQPYFFKNTWYWYENSTTEYKDDYKLIGLKHKRGFNYEDEFVEERSCSDTWYYVDNSDSLCIIPGDTLCYPILCEPQWKCKGSLSSFILKFNKKGIFAIGKGKCPYGTLVFDFGDYVKIETMTPMPDSIWSTGFAFTNKETLETINENGIDGFCKYPAMESWQTVRTFALTTLLATLLSIFIGLIYNAIIKHNKLKSFLVNIISSIVVSFLLYNIIYICYRPLVGAIEDKNVLVIILYLILYVIICICSYQFILHICKKFTISFMAYLADLCICILFVMGTTTLPSSTAFYESYENAFNVLVYIIWIVSVLLPILVYIYRDSMSVQIRKRFKRIYGIKLLPSYISKNYYTSFLWALLISILLILIISIPYNVGGIKYTSFILSLSLYGCIILFLNTTKILERNQVVWKWWKKVIKSYIALQIIWLVFAILYALLFAYIAWINENNMRETIQYSLFALMLAISYVTPSYLYKPTLVIRYMKNTRAKRFISYKKNIKRYFRIS